MKLHIDFETRSEVDLRDRGLHNYARGKYTDIMCMGFAFDKGPVELWKEKTTFPMDVLFHVQSGGEVVAHNAPFELEIWNEVGVKKFKWPVLKPEQTFCTMAMAYSMSLPGSLEHLAPALGIDEQKDLAGGRIMLQLSKPKKILEDGTPIFYTREEVPEKFEVLYKYCPQDVEVERTCEERMLKLIPSERELWLLDHKINQRGVQIDIKAVKKAIEIVEFEKKRLDEEMRDVTDNGVAMCTANAQLSSWLKFRGIETDGVAKDKVIDLLKKKDLPSDVRRALELRQEAAKSSTAKLKTMIQKAGMDGRVRHTLQYHGAGTGRWAGRGIQVQNFPRQNMKPEEVEQIFSIMGA